MIVTVTFDDHVNADVIDYYRLLFPWNRTNPNDCPITGTFFVCDAATDYGHVVELHERGHELGSHSVNHHTSHMWWRTATLEQIRGEMAGMRDRFQFKASIPADAVKGLRMPFLEIHKGQFDMMQDSGFLYDASMMTMELGDGHDGRPVWPFTLDTPPSSYYCNLNRNCPVKDYPGLWEMPMNRWYNLKHQTGSLE